ncbi:MAG: hypothetical protein R3A13_10125 [Bdellovibrionota bacterium]
MNKDLRITSLKCSICIAFTLMSFIFSACGQIRFEPLSQDGKARLSTASNWQSGMLATYRAMPPVTSSRSLYGMGFIPSASANTLMISRETGEVSLMDKNQTVLSSFGIGANRLNSGTYEVMHKQRNAAWYAPDSYYKSRGMRVPPEGDKSRYMRGALGDFVLYLDKSTPIHSGPLWNGDIGGVKIEEETLSKIYHSLEVGDRITVR